MENNQTIRFWLRWLTEERLLRWNHLRDRAGAPPLTVEDGALILSHLPADVVTQLKERIR